MTQPACQDVGVAMEDGDIFLIGDGDKKLAVLPGDKASALRDMLTDMIWRRNGTSIEELESESDTSVCRHCGSLTIHFDPAIEFVLKNQCEAVLVPTFGVSHRCMLTTGHEGAHFAEQDPLEWS